MKSFVLTLIMLNSLKALAIDPNKIIGENDLVAVNADGSNIPLKYKKLIDAFGLINISCTATHIGNGYVLTAGHCFWVGTDLSKDLPCNDITIEWGSREGISPYLKSTCENIVFAQRNSVIDFAILKVYPFPEVAIDIDLSRKAAVGDSVTIFSHPEDLSLRWSKTCIVESQLDPVFSSEALQHKCDTNPGSSGATIIDAETNKIVGIHNGGRSEMNYGTFLTNPVVVNALNELGFN